MTWLEPAWGEFEKCKKCGAETGEACKDLRNPAFTISMRHPGRKLTKKRRRRYPV